MTKHLTREEAASFAKSAGLTTSNVSDLTDTLNAAIDYKLKEWETQMEHIAWKHCDFDHAVFQKDCPKWPEQGWVKLYTRALPAQPAQDVNAGSVAPVNPYRIGSPRSAWLAGYTGTTNFGAKDSDNDRQWKEGAAARKKYDATISQAQSTPVQGVPK